MRLTCRLPEMTDRQILQEYMEEHYAAGESKVSASMRLPVTPFEEWTALMKRNAEIPDETWGRSYTLLCLDGDRLVGLLSVRWELSETLRWQVGDVGYGVRPSERRKGYATEMLEHALTVCREKGKKEVVIGCYKDNRASARVIEKNGGRLAHESEAYQKGKVSQYYIIDCA